MTSVEALASTAIAASFIKYAVDVSRWLLPQYLTGQGPARLAVILGVAMYTVGFYLNKTPLDMDLLTALGYGFFAGVSASGFHAQIKIPTKVKQTEIQPQLTNAERTELNQAFSGGSNDAKPLTNSAAAFPVSNYQTKFDQKQRG